MRRGVRIRTCTHQPYSAALEPMDRPQSLETNDVVDLELPVNDDEYQEAVTGQPEDGAVGDGTPLEQGEDPTGPNPGGAAGVDAHDGQTTGDGQVAGPSGLQGGAIADPVEASTTGAIQNPVPPNRLVTQAMHVDGVQAPGAVPSVRFRPPDLSEQYALPRMPYSRVEQPPAAMGRPVPAPTTATIRNTITAPTVMTLSLIHI